MTTGKELEEGKKGNLIILHFYPKLSLTEKASVDDKKGIDAYDLEGAYGNKGDSYQLKFVGGAFKSGTIYRQVASISNSTGKRIENGHEALYWIFVSWLLDRGWVIRVPFSTLRELEIKYNLPLIKTTRESATNWDYWHEVDNWFPEDRIRRIDFLVKDLPEELR